MLSSVSSMPVGAAGLFHPQILRRSLAYRPAPARHANSTASSPPPRPRPRRVSARREAEGNGFSIGGDSPTQPAGHEDHIGELRRPRGKAVPSVCAEGRWHRHGARTACTTSGTDQMGERAKRGTDPSHHTRDTAQHTPHRLWPQHAVPQVTSRGCPSCRAVVGRGMADGALATPGGIKPPLALAARMAVLTLFVAIGDGFSEAIDDGHLYRA